MYLARCRIRNVKCFEDVELDFRHPDGSIRRWNVLIGENGTDKTTLLRAIAIALMGEKATLALLRRPSGWLRTGATKAGAIEATVLPGDLDVELTANGERLGKPITIRLQVQEQEITERRSKDSERVAYLQQPETHGWFAAGYGPFRRLSGGTRDTDVMLAGTYREARFVTLFQEGAALSSCEQWLRDLDYARQDSRNPERSKSAALLETIETTLNNYLLPEQVRLVAVSSQGVLFRTPYAAEVQMSELSDGYRAMLALGLDLLRRLSQSFAGIWNRQPDWLQHITGVVLIDELDAHLHPSWQRQIGGWLKSRFPRMQFIVATHSPFITQAADEGGLYVLRQSEREADRVEVYQDEESVRGWRVDQILTSELFGLETTRAPEVEAQLKRYDTLLTQRAQQRLTQEEAAELAHIEATLDHTLPPPGETTAQRELHQRLQAYIARTLNGEQ